MSKIFGAASCGFSRGHPRRACMAVLIMRIFFDVKSRNERKNVELLYCE